MEQLTQIHMRVKNRNISSGRDRGIWPTRLHDFQLTWSAYSIGPYTTHKYPIDENPVPLESWISWLKRIHFIMGRIILYYSLKTRNLTQVRVFSEPWFAPTLSQTLESTASLLGSINACNTFPYTLSWLEKKPLLILFSQLCAQHQPILPKSQIFDPKCSRLRVTRKSRYFDVLVLHDALSVCNN